MNETHIWCDGGCRNNQEKENVGGYGVVIKYNNQIFEYYQGEFNTTNNKQELTSLVVGLAKTKDKKTPVTVIMDSSYVINGMTKWRQKWVNRGFKTSSGKKLKNQFYWITLFTLVDEFESINFVLCKGHSDNAGNERADELANKAMDEMETFKQRNESN